MGLKELINKLNQKLVKISTEEKELYDKTFEETYREESNTFIMAKAKRDAKRKAQKRHGVKE